MATAKHSWTCPACGRRVPLRVDRCHCGATRGQAEQAAAAATMPRRHVRRGPGLGAELATTMPRDVKALVVTGALVTLVGLGWLAFGPRRPDTTPRVLGFVDPGPPPVPKPTPLPSPPFKLPWCLALVEEFHQKGCSVSCSACPPSSVTPKCKADESGGQYHCKSQ